MSRPITGIINTQELKRSLKAKFRNRSVSGEELKDWLIKKQKIKGTHYFADLTGVKLKSIAKECGINVIENRRSPWRTKN